MDAHLWQHPSGTFYARWPEGRISRRKSLQTRDPVEAKRRLRNWNRDMSDSKIITIAAEENRLRITLKPFIREFLEQKETEVEGSTMKLYINALNKAVECWGDIPLGHITSRHIDLYKNSIIKSGLKKVTANKNYRHLKAALKVAIEWDYIVKLNFPKMFPVPSEARFLTVKELRKIIGACPDQEFADLCMFAAYTGLRAGEIVRLMHWDIDSPPGFIRVSSKQKNKTESRIPLTTMARAILDKYPGTGHVFRFRSENWISQKFRKIRTEAGVTGAKFHDLRHTYASHLAMENKDIRSIQMLMRHKSLASTQVYANLSPAYLAQVAECLDYGPMPVSQCGIKKKQQRE